MKTYIECIPCFFRQAIDATVMAGFSSRKQKKVIDELGAMLGKLSLSSSPPEAARILNKILQKNAKGKDIYARIKQKSNDIGLRMYEKLKKKTAKAQDSLLAAIEIAIMGNIIDYGAKNHLDVDKELDRMFHEEDRIIKKEKKQIFNYREFSKKLKQAKTILYLGDNAGETVFDRVLIEQISKDDAAKKIIYAVKDKPVINDALKQDAVYCGIDKTAEIISSGSDAPGTVLSLCSREFLRIYKNADMIISKGQGNFEALSNAKRPVFFLFMAKCAVIASTVGANIGDIILLYHAGGKGK